MSYSHQVPFDFGEQAQIIIAYCRKMRSLMYIPSLPIHIFRTNKARIQHVPANSTFEILE